MEISHSPHTHPMGVPVGIPIPTAALLAPVLPQLVHINNPDITCKLSV